VQIERMVRGLPAMMSLMVEEVSENRSAPLLEWLARRGRVFLHAVEYPKAAQTGVEYQLAERLEEP